MKNICQQRFVCCWSVLVALSFSVLSSAFAELEKDQIIAEQYAFLVAYKKHASEEQWEALKLLIQIHGYEPVLNALHSVRNSDLRSEQKTEIPQQK